MISIGLISDTHGFLDQNVYKHFDIVDEIWHAGDIGENSVLEDLSTFKPCKAVFGNIDTIEMQRSLPEVLIETIEGVKIMMIHIAGRPGRYAKGVSALIQQHQPHLLICGHSHILRVERDAKHNVLYINPGAAGQHGFHQKRTLIRFTIDQGKVNNMEVIELGRRGRT
jgi:putative phosphoesterase